MNVEQFVHDSLYQIARAVQRVNVTFDAEGIGAEAHLPNADDEFRDNETCSELNTVQHISFDIAVTASQGGERENGGGLKVVSSPREGTGSTTAETSSVSRIAFILPLKLKEKPFEARGLATPGAYTT